MDHQRAQEWLDRYIAAWRSNEEGQIRGLFTEDVEYAYHPYDEPMSGVDTVVGSWMRNVDPPGSWEASYEPYAVDGDRVVATGTSRYFAREEHPERLYHNCFLIEFEGDRAKRFTELFVKAP